LSTDPRLAPSDPLPDSHDAPVNPVPTSDPAAPGAARVWTVSVGESRADVEVTARDHDRLGDVLEPVGAALGRPVGALWGPSGRLADDLPLTAPELAHGAVLGLDGPTREGSRSGTSALELRVVGGPDAGRAVPLAQGTHVLGRGGDSTVRLDDPDVSRRHVAVDVGGGSITVADLGSTNGSRLDDVELDRRPRAWAPGAVLRLGGSAVTVAGPAGSPVALEGGSAGRVRVRPTPRMAGAG